MAFRAAAELRKTGALSHDDVRSEFTKFKAEWSAVMTHERGKEEREENLPAGK